MKTNAHRSVLLAAVIVASASGIAIPAAVAGAEGSLGRKNSNVPVAADSAKRASPDCTDARWVTITETKPGWHNGRGPRLTTEVGKKLECTSCDTPMVVMKPSGHNGRGAMAPVAIKGKHACTKERCGPELASAK